MNLKNKVQLITYPDSLGKNLKDLKFVLDNYLKDVIGGVHILPFYPSSADRGFCPLTHLEVDSLFGNWNDVKEIANKYDLMVDLMINHLSSESEYFKDYLAKNEESKYKDLFLCSRDVFEDAIIDMNMLKMIYRPRPAEPFFRYQFDDGTVKKMWTSFTPNQIDLNWSSNVTVNLVKEFVLKLTESGAKVVRLDAVGYIVKELGTNCFFLPKVYDIIGELKRSVSEYDVKMLPEVHHHFSLQQEIAKREDYVYDFALPLLVLHTLYTCNSNRLKHWINIRPTNCFTTLDTHDGIGTIDVEGLIPQDELNVDLSLLYKFGGNATMRATGEGSDNVDIYQINCTYYSALGKNDNAYLCARAIQFFLPGIPQVYYVGLFAGENDVELLNETNCGRDINRHYYSVEEIKESLKKPVVEELFKLMKFRNTHPCFDGEFSLEESGDEFLKLCWRNGDDYCKLVVDLKNYYFEIEDSLKEKVFIKD